MYVNYEFEHIKCHSPLAVFKVHLAQALKESAEWETMQSVLEGPDVRAPKWDAPLHLAPVQLQENRKSVS